MPTWAPPPPPKGETMTDQDTDQTDRMTADLKRANARVKGAVILVEDAVRAADAAEAALEAANRDLRLARTDRDNLGFEASVPRGIYLVRNAYGYVAIRPVPECNGTLVPTSGPHGVTVSLVHDDAAECPVFGHCESKWGA